MINRNYKVIWKDETGQEDHKYSLSRREAVDFANWLHHIKHREGIAVVDRSDNAGLHWIDPNWIGKTRN